MASLTRASKVVDQTGTDHTSLVLMLNGENAGHIKAAYTRREAPSGGHTVYAVARIWAGPLEGGPSAGSAGGGGYCKTSAAMADALNGLPGTEGTKPLSLGGVGVHAVVRYLKTFGYQVIEV